MFKRYKIIILLASLLILPTIVLADDRGVGVVGKDGASQRRVALVIGNANYQSSPLRNPVNDAEDTASALRSLGFQVTLGTDMTRKEMRRVIRTFGESLKQGGVGLFYYSGHGMQVGGTNYLIPIGADISMEDEVQDEAVDAGSVLRKMDSAKNSMNMVFLDACRDNPFARSFRSSFKGLAQMDAPSGSLIVYATAPGSVAADGEGRNGTFTKNLLAHLSAPGMELSQMMKIVRSNVRKETDGKQVPWESSSLEGNFYFNSSSSDSILSTGSMVNERIKLEQERLKLEEKRKRIAALQSLQEEKQKLEEERKRLKEEQGRLARVQPEKRITNPPEYDKALAAFRSRKYDESIRLFHNLDLSNPPNKLKDNIAFWIGTNYVALEKYDDAILQFETVLNKFSGGSKVHDSRYMLGITYSKKGETSRAVEVLEGALKKNPPAEVRGRILAQLNQIQASLPPSAPAKAQSNGKCPDKMSFIPGGDLLAGKVSPFKEMNIKAICMDKYEVTQAEYERVIGTNPSEFKGGFFDSGDDHPVEGVTWHEAKEFCQKMNKRLPTEREWEKAAKAGTTTKYYWGNEHDGAYTWTARSGESGTHTVGQKKPNNYGLYDIYGNVWEWTDSNYDSSKKVLRGGSWDDDPGGVRSDRIGSGPTVRNNDVGFRCSK
jgi:formylglycine-generating enzyme required for sulfatase activity